MRVFAGASTLNLLCLDSCWRPWGCEICRTSTKTFQCFSSYLYSKKYCFLYLFSTTLVYVSEIPAHVHFWLDLQTRMWHALAWSESPSSQRSGLGSSRQTGLFSAREVGDIFYKIAWKTPSPLKSVTEMLSQGLNRDFTIHLY